MNNVVYPIQRLSFVGSRFAIVVIRNPGGSFMYREEHEKIINKLHEVFNLENISFPSAPVYRPYKTVSGLVDVLSALDKNEFKVSDYPFVKVSDHDAIIGIIERQIPIFMTEESNS